MLRNFKLIMVVTLTLLSLNLAACETMSGAGRDLQNAGKAIQDAAN